MLSAEKGSARKIICFSIPIGTPHLLWEGSFTLYILLRKSAPEMLFIENKTELKKLFPGLLGKNDGNRVNK